LMVPRFVLAELQNIADSDDAMRRGRGRRGLETLNQLREQADVTVEITEEDAPEIREVDAKLVALAQRLGGDVLTTDYNLNRVAQIQGVKVLNVNELSNAIRPVVLPGEELLVRVVQPGKERNQGVGYLADGTMIVVENGDKLMGQEVATEVTRVFQTVAGKMIFATPRKPVGGRPERTPEKPAEQRRPEATEAAPAVTEPAPAADAAKPAAPAAGRPNNNRSNRGSRRPNAMANPTQAPGSGAPASQAPASADAPAAPSATSATMPADRPTPPNARPQRPRQQSGRHSGAIEDRLVRHNHGESV
jgi:rRNA-processing protein FCF1